MSTPIYRDKFTGFDGYIIDNWAYTASGQVEYHGIAIKGSLSSHNAWLIEKFTYDGSDRAASRRTSEASVKWDDYLTETYS